MKLLIFLFPALLLAQEPKPVAKPEPPAISAELRSKYWRAQNELNIAEAAAAKARDRAREVMYELQKSCAANLPLVLDGAGEPACTSNPPITTETTSPEK